MIGTQGFGEFISALLITVELCAQNRDVRTFLGDSGQHVAGTGSTVYDKEFVVSRQCISEQLTVHSGPVGRKYANDLGIFRQRHCVAHNLNY